MFSTVPVPLMVFMLIGLGTAITIRYGVPIWGELLRQAGLVYFIAIVIGGVVGFAKVKLFQQSWAGQLLLYLLEVASSIGLFIILIGIGRFENGLGILLLWLEYSATAITASLLRRHDRKTVTPSHDDTVANSRP